MGADRPGCHHFRVTPFYDENSLKLLLKTFLDVVASVNVSFMRSKKVFAAKSDFFALIFMSLIQLLSLIALFAGSSSQKICGSFNPFIDAFICDRKWGTKTRILGENLHVCAQQYQLYCVKMHIFKMK